MRPVWMAFAAIFPLFAAVEVFEEKLLKSESLMEFHSDSVILFEPE